VAKREVNAAAKHDWAMLRASEAKDQREKRKGFEALEEEKRKKAKDRSRAPSKGKEGC
jgi:hypothetical protein